ncbi:MAG: ankyrin repeat domain-containing protein [Acidimicrobiia bacterium]
MPEVDDPRVRPALHAMLSGDTSGLRSAIEADPEIVAIAWGENTLLEWVTQPPHGMSDEIVETLIVAGSTLNRALNLAGCWNLDRLCSRLVDAGADPAAIADAGITPLESAALHGSTRAADVLFRHGLHRPSLWLAAATGQLVAVRSWVGADGRLLKSPGHYRPNLADVGHPPGLPPTEDPGEIIGEAVVFAGANNRMGVVDYLLAGGADIDARPYLNTTALHLAVLFTNSEAVEGLLERGASRHIVDVQHSSDAAGWARACLSDDSPASQRIAELLDA